MAENLKTGTLFLIPAPLGEGALGSIPAGVAATVSRLRYFIAEELRTARRYLKKLHPDCRIDDLTIFLVNEHTDLSDASAFLEPLLHGHDTGLLSEAGLPCIADPGAEIVRMAHDRNIRVVPMSGPSSILLALVASGMNGQHFIFHGYLPIDRTERIRKLKELEIKAASGQTQIFMETPYRNNKLLEAIVETLTPGLRLCIAAGITTDEEWIRTCTLRAWKNLHPPIDKVPAVFVLGC